MLRFRNLALVSAVAVVLLGVGTPAASAASSVAPAPRSVVVREAYTPILAAGNRLNTATAAADRLSAGNAFYAMWAPAANTNATRKATLDKIVTALQTGKNGSLTLTKNSYTCVANMTNWYGRQIVVNKDASAKIDKVLDQLAGVPKRIGAVKTVTQVTKATAEAGKAVAKALTEGSTLTKTGPGLSTIASVCLQPAPETLFAGTGNLPWILSRAHLNA